MSKVTARGIGFNVVQMGGGEHTLVFVHGFVADNLSTWYMNVASAVAEHASLVMYDLRGHGLSDRPASGYGMSDHAEDLAALLDAIGLGSKRVTIVANSAGGVVTLNFALRYPERVESLVLVDSATAREDFGRDMAATLGIKDGEPSPDAQEILEKLLGDQILRDQAKQDTAQYLRGLDRLSKRRRNPLLARMETLVNETTLVADLLATPPLSDETLAQIQAPVLALYGAGSVQRHEGERLKRVLPCCDVRYLPGCEHLVIRQRPELLRQELIEWVQRL